ncbi:MAG TPA: hypothetical protein VE078_03570 [Thermoanaerobaculia bacterium]|nr:hypothetical protein [Thermoanaerobaculia bacterium]
MPRAFLALLLLLGGLAFLRTFAAATGDAGNHFDPNGSPRTTAGGHFDPNGQAETDAGNNWDPNG